MTETKSPDLFGRRVLKSSVRVITPENVLDVLERARYEHEKNRSEIERRTADFAAYQKNSPRNQ